MKSILLAFCAHMALVSAPYAQIDSTDAAPPPAVAPAEPSVPAVSAQGPAVPAREPLGFGVSIGFPSHENPEEGFVAPQTTFYLLIRNNGMRIEPEVSLFHYGASSSDSYYGFEQSIAVTALRLGGGIFTATRRGATEIYWGARIGVLRETYEIEYDDGYESESLEAKRTNLYAGPAMGAEHFLAPAFSLGAEGQLIYTIFGDLESDDGDVSSFEDVKQLDTRAYLFVRWYL